MPASINGALNAVFIQGDYSNKITFIGEGAGADPTASSVVSDIINAARNHKLKNKFHDCMECHIKPDLLLIYSVDNNKKEIYLYRLGSHSELFG